MKTLMSTKKVLDGDRTRVRQLKLEVGNLQILKEDLHYIE